LVAIITGLSSEEASMFLKTNNPIGAFGAGYGFITKPILGPYGTLFALVTLNTFVLTTLDTATRITRMLTQELFHIQNRTIATILVVLAAGWLALSGEGNKVWPVFGASNQLVAALTLLVLTMWLRKEGKPTSITFWPAVFMIITAASALVYQGYHFALAKSYFLTILNFSLVLLSLFLIYEVIVSIRQHKQPR